MCERVRDGAAVRGGSGGMEGGVARGDSSIQGGSEARDSGFARGGSPIQGGGEVRDSGFARGGSPARQASSPSRGPWPRPAACKGEGMPMGDNTVWRAKEPSPAKGYLGEYRLLKLRRDALVEELDRLREATLRATSRITATRLSGTGSRGGMEESAIRRVDGEAALGQVIAHIDECLAARLALLERLGDERHKLILTCRYIHGRGWEEIGHRMHYERSMIFKLHGEALEAFGRELGREGSRGTGPEGAAKEPERHSG